jgi:hypothetical protein
LKEGHFQFNECVDYRGDDESLLSGLMEEIKENCENPHGNSARTSTPPQSFYHDEYSVGIYDDPNDYEDYESWDIHPIPHIKSTTEKTWMTSPTANPEELEAEDSFIRRNAILIVTILIAIIGALVFVFYKVNAYNRLNWR